MPRTATAGVLTVLADVAGSRENAYTRAGISEAALRKGINDDELPGAWVIEQLAKAFPGHAEQLLRAWVADRNREIAADAEEIARAANIAWSGADRSQVQRDAAALVERLIDEVPEGDGRWIKFATDAFRGIAEGARPLQARAPG